MLELPFVFLQALSEPASTPASQVREFLSSPYSLSFFLGAFIIAVFAHRQLESYSAEFPKDQRVILKLASASLIGGRRLFRRAYVYYVVVLELFYIVVCTVQPVITAVFGDPSSDALAGTPIAPLIASLFGGDADAKLSSSPAWPLAAALLIVGFGPNFPVAVQIEQTFRRFSHRVAGIPEHLLHVIDRLQNFDFKKLSHKSDDIDEFFATAEEVEHAAMHLGLSAAAARSLNEDIVCTLTLQYFTLSKRSESIWAESLRMRFNEASDFLGPRLSVFTNELTLFLEDVRGSPFITAFRARVPAASAGKQVDYRGAIEDFLAEAHSASSGSAAPPQDLGKNRRELKLRLAKLALDASSLASQTQALFALYIVNDKPLAHESDPIFIIQKHTLIARSRFIWDALMLSFALACIVAFFGLTAVVTTERIYLGEISIARFGLALGEILKVSATSTFGLLLIFGLSAFVAAFLRFSKEETSDWQPFLLSGNNFPVGQYLSVLLIASAVTGGVNVAYFLISQYLGALPFDKIVSTFFEYNLAGRLLYAVTGGIFSIYVCLVLDRWSTHRLRSRDGIILPFSAGLAVCLFGCAVLVTMVMSPEALLKQPQFLINEAFGLLVFSVVALKVFIILLLRVPFPKAVSRPDTPPKAWARLLAASIVAVTSVLSIRRALTSRARARRLPKEPGR